MDLRLRSYARRVGTTLRAYARHPIDVIGVVLAFVWGAPSLIYPFGSDQAIHWYLGYGLLQGQLPYVHGISGKPPGIFMLHALAILLFGNSQAAIRWLELVGIGIEAWLLTRLVRLSSRATYDGQLGSAALLVSIVNFTYQDYWNTAHPEFWMGVCLVAGLVIALEDDKPLRRPLLVGALTGFTFVLKYTGALVALPIAALCGARALYEVDTQAKLSERTRERMQALSREALLFVAGMSLVVGICVSPYAITRHLRQLREVCWDMTVAYEQATISTEDWYSGLFKPHRNQTLIATAALSWSLGLAVAIRKRAFVALALGSMTPVLIVAAIASVSIQGRYYGYHYIVVYPFVIFACLWGASLWLPQRGLLQMALVLALGIAAFFYAPTYIASSPNTYREHVERIVEYARGLRSADELAADYYRGYGADMRDLRTIARAINARKKPGDTMCMQGFTSPIYILTGLRCRSRHAIGDFVPLGPPSWWLEYERAMHTYPPTFFVAPAKRIQLLKWQARNYTLLKRTPTCLVMQRSP